MSEAMLQATDQLVNDVYWTELGHFEEKELWLRWHYRLGGSAAVGAAVATGSIVADGWPIVGGAFGLVGAIGAALVTFLRPDEQARQHLAAGRSLGTLRREAQYFRDLDLPQMEQTDARARLEELTVTKAALHEQTPSTSNRAMKLVAKRLKAGDYATEKRWA